jgi:hypothetical protein
MHVTFGLPLFKLRLICAPSSNGEIWHGLCQTKMVSDRNLARWAIAMIAHDDCVSLAGPATEDHPVCRRPRFSAPKQ